VQYINIDVREGKVMIKKIIQYLEQKKRERETIAALSRLSEDQLKDIGIYRDRIEFIAKQNAAQG
jgi:uncharacterized protein YjiS (DUF1127 family)